MTILFSLQDRQESIAMQSYLTLTFVISLVSLQSVANAQNNPLGVNCRCQDEFWVTDQCTSGFVCDLNSPDEGEYIECPTVRILSIN